MSQSTSQAPATPTLPTAAPAAPVVEASRAVTLSGVRWNSVLEFTHLFKGFRFASNPVKLIVALLAIFVVYTAGRLFDAVWGPQVASGEIEYYQSHTSDEFKQFREQFDATRRDAIANELYVLGASGKASVNASELAANPRAAYRQLKSLAIDDFHGTVKDLAQRRSQRETEIRAAATQGMTFSASLPTPAEEEQHQRERAAYKLESSVRRARHATGRGIFDAFMAYEIKQFDALVDNTLSFVRVQPVKGPDGGGGAALSPGLVSKNPDNFFENTTVVGCIANMTITGPSWLFTSAGPMQYRPADAHTWPGWLKMVGVRAGYLLSLLLFAAVFLAAVAWSGAFISRLTALEFAGQERPPLKDIFAFVNRKFWTFFTAPVVPFVILLVAGLGLAAAGLIGAVPIIGEIIVGVLFIAFIGGGFILALVLLGIIGGFNLMYPTLAVEGSDTFDAMSRSFAYVYARPWRLVTYSVVILVYGVITILFVSLSIYLVLALTHLFAGWGMSLFGAHMGAYSGQPKLNTLWPMPQFGRLTAPVNWYAMSTSEYIGGMFLHFWTFTVIGLLGAYVVSYYHSSHTILYFLLRRSVEGQSLGDIYLESPQVEKIAKTVAAEAPVTGGRGDPNAAREG